jgi:hypothetical protein
MDRDKIDALFRLTRILDIKIRAAGQAPGHGGGIRVATTGPA